MTNHRETNLFEYRYIHIQSTPFDEKIVIEASDLSSNGFYGKSSLQACRDAMIYVDKQKRLGVKLYHQFIYCTIELYVPPNFDLTKRLSAQDLDLTPSINLTLGGYSRENHAEARLVILRELQAAASQYDPELNVSKLDVSDILRIEPSLCKSLFDCHHNLQVIVAPRTDTLFGGEDTIYARPYVKDVKQLKVVNQSSASLPILISY